MLYCFKPSDKFFLDLCETTDLAGLLDTFLSYHKEELKTRFSETLSKAKKTAKGSKALAIVDDMSSNDYHFEEFFETVGDAVKVHYYRSFLKLQNQKGPTAYAAARSYAEKMCHDPSNPQYTGELNQIVTKCCDAILEAFDSIAE